MPPFPLLPEEVRNDLVEYVRYLAVRGEFEQLLLDLSWDEEELADAQEAYEIVVGRWQGDSLRAVYPAIPEPPADARSIELGRTLYFDAGRANCAACHGLTGLGDGPSATEFLDEWGYPIRPRDLTTGVFGGSLGPEEIWGLVHFVQSLARSQR